MVSQGKSNCHEMLYFGTDMSEITVQTQIRLLFKEQSDLGLHCLPLPLHLLDTLLYGNTIAFASIRHITVWEYHCLCIY